MDVSKVDEAGKAYRTGNDIAVKPNLRELARFFLRLGTTGFGGPAAHIAMMEDEVVRRRQWVAREKFLDLLGAANIIPGPSSTEMAIFIGYLCRGWAGLLLAGVCFIAPAMVIVIGFAWAYMRFGNLPQVTWLLYGVKPVVIAIILQALWQLGRSAVKDKFLGTLTILGIILNFWGINILVLLFGTGVIAGMRQGLTQDRARNWKPLVIMLLSACCFLAAAYFATGLYSTGKVAFGLLPLFLFFVKVGSIVFGSGNVLLAFLQADLVGHWHLLTTTQLLDAIAVGQVTPRPGLYHCHLHRLLTRRSAGRPDRHRRDFSPLIYLGRGQQSSYPAFTQVSRGRSLPGRCDCGFPGPHGRCYLAPGA